MSSHKSAAVCVEEPQTLCAAASGPGPAGAAPGAELTPLPRTLLLSFIPSHHRFALLRPIHLSLPPPPLANVPLLSVVALVTIKRGFPSQLCHRGNAWLSSRPLLGARRPLVHYSRLLMTNFDFKDEDDPHNDDDDDNDTMRTFIWSFVLVFVFASPAACKWAQSVHIPSFPPSCVSFNCRLFLLETSHVGLV